MSATPKPITGACLSCMVPMTDGFKLCDSCCLEFDRKERYRERMDLEDRYGSPDEYRDEPENDNEETEGEDE